MTQIAIKKFVEELYSKPPKRNYIINKTDVYPIDGISRLDILDLKVYGPENNIGYRYFLVVSDNFSKFGWTVFLKNEIAQRIEDSFENILLKSQTKPKLIELIEAKKFIIIFFKIS